MSTTLPMLKIYSNPRNVALIEGFVDKVCKKHRIQTETYGNILISLTEAVTNAIIHGNKNDESKSVKIDLKKKGGSIAFRVSDEGIGFNPEELPDPTAPENITKCGGRGVFLMRQLSDQLRFENNGRTVEMQFRL